MSISAANMIDRLIDEAVPEHGPGCAVGVIEEGELTYLRCAGLANIEHAIPVSGCTKFHLASLSKHFTAFAIALLADRGLLSLDADIREYVSDPFPKLRERITLRQLVHHTSGLRDQWDLVMAAGWRMDDVITTRDILDVLRSQRTLNFAPGTSYSYCNTGYTLLAEAVRAVSDVSLREFCELEMFGPLGMRDTHFHDDYTEVVGSRAESYFTTAGVHRRAVLSYATAGATSLSSTVADLARWDRNFYTGAVGGAAVLNQMHEVGRLNDGMTTPYAFGLMVDMHRGTRRVYHGGGDAGYTSYLVRFPDMRLSAIVLSNGGRLLAPLFGDRIADLCLDAARRSQYERPSRPASQTLSRYDGLFADRDTGLALRLSHDGDQLLVATGDGPQPVTHIGDGRFALPGYVEAWFAEESAVARIRTWSYSGSGYDLDRVQQLKPGAEELRDYIGRYWCEELAAGCMVLLEGSGLVLRRTKLASMQLEPTVADTFIGRWGDPHAPREFAMRFFRSDHDVVGFYHSFPRSRGIRFDRLGPACGRQP